MASKTNDIRIVLTGTEGGNNVNRSANALVKCSDGRHLQIPKEFLEACTFITAPANDEEIVEFEYPANVLESLVRWTVQYGVAGSAASAMVRPCLYRDFSYVLTDKWDNEFYNSRLIGPLYQKYYLETMNAADKLGMTGLLDFMAMGLGCRLRNEEEPVIIHDIMGLDKDVDVTDEDLTKVSQEYPWFDEVTKPVNVK